MVHGVTVILSGAGRLHADGETRAVEAGDVIVFSGCPAERLRYDEGPGDRVEAMAEELGCSPGHFRRRFRRAMGMSPAAYQLRERMTRAAAMLRTHDVQGTATALGYSDPFVFSRQFKAQVGVPPKVFRAALRGAKA